MAVARAEDRGGQQHDAVVRPHERLRVLTRRAAAEPHPAYGTGGRARAPGEHVFVPRQHRFDGAPAGVDVRVGAVPQVVSIL